MFYSKQEIIDYLSSWCSYFNIMKENVTTYGSSAVLLHGLIDESCDIDITIPYSEYEKIKERILKDNNIEQFDDMDVRVITDIEKYNKNKTITSDNIEQRIVDVLTKSDEKYVLYRGSLIDYQLNDSNSVDFIVLASPRKQIIGEIVTKDISSNYFIIPYSEVLNINIKYLEVDIENTETVE